MSAPNDNPAGVPPGEFPAEKIVGIEITMNATIRECVFATEFLDAGDVEAALDALLQIKLNAEQATSDVEMWQRLACGDPETRQA